MTAEEAYNELCCYHFRHRQQRQEHTADTLRAQEFITEM
jgi:hypothetical protein